GGGDRVGFVEHSIPPATERRLRVLCHVGTVPERRRATVVHPWLPLVSEAHVADVPSSSAMEDARRAVLGLRPGRCL
ncbi:unnamed protein product, partial [Urochloa humidicola]